MTTPSADAMPAPAVADKPAPLWEDFIDIFHSPSAVYERRRDANPWPMILIITLLVTLIGVLTFNALAPVYETEARAAIQKAMASNPQVTEDMMNGQVKFQLLARRWGGVMFFLGVLLMSLPVWALGRIAGAKELTYTRSMVVFSWAAIIGVVSLLVLGIQALVTDVSAITSLDKLGLSAARFANKETMSPFLYGVLKAIDPFAIWSAILMGIGARVTGRGTRNTAIIFAVTWIVVSALVVGLFTARAAA
jgi:hypothetical protein